MPISSVHSNTPFFFAPQRRTPIRVTILAWGGGRFAPAAKATKTSRRRACRFLLRRSKRTLPAHLRRTSEGPVGTDNVSPLARPRRFMPHWRLKAPHLPA
ncbi:hypothetical protein EWH08_18590 [Sphingobium indicum]|uniref:Uncharacterized protein n=1 Tax=Sphingobium indicum TaxID=332055 RepID=A0A4Q4IW76_9SPHN|nr:hypothetical protein EWH08_18590 [Sphingobium indicum]